MLTLAGVKLLTSKCCHTCGPAAGLARLVWPINQKTDSITSHNGVRSDNCNQNMADYAVFDYDVVINSIVSKECIFLLI